MCKHTLLHYIWARYLKILSVTNKHKHEQDRGIVLGRKQERKGHHHLHRNDSCP